MLVQIRVFSPVLLFLFINLIGSNELGGGTLQHYYSYDNSNNIDPSSSNALSNHIWINTNSPTTPLYSLPQSITQHLNEPLPTGHIWKLSECSRNCGGGVKKLELVCAEANG